MESTLSTVKSRASFQLFWRLSSRHFQEEPVRFLLTILGIGLGMALVVAIRLANGAAIASFQDSIDLMAGKANLSLSSSSGSLSEDLLKELVHTRRYGTILPILQGKIALKDSPQQYLTVLCVDLLKDTEARDYQMLGPEGKRMNPPDFLALLPQPDLIFLTQKYALEKGLRAGQKVSFLVNDKVQILKVGGLLADVGAGKALDGTLALMDIAAAQKTLGKIGQIDRLEWVIPNTSDRDGLEEKLQKLYPTLKVERPARRGEKVEKMLAAFQANLTALSLVSLLVGAFLIYNSMSIAVLRRVEEIGVLRTLGVTQKQIAGWILTESFLLALAGAVLGLVFGKILAYDVLRLIGQTIRNLYVPIPLEQRLPSLSFTFYWILLGMGLILAATLPSVFSAAKIPPSLSVRKGYPEVAFERNKSFLSIAGLAAWVLAAFFSTLPSWNGLPFFGYSAAFLLLMGAVLLTPFWMSAFYGTLEKNLIRFLPSEAFLGFRNLLSGLSRSSVAVGALVMAVALMVSVAVMVGSFRQTVILWMGETLKADLYIRPAADRGGQIESKLDPETLKVLSAGPGIKAMERFRSVPVSWQGNDFFISALDMGVLSQNGNVVLKTGGDPKALLKSLVDQPAVFVSEPMALKRQLKVGDWIPLPAPTGPVSVQIRAVFYDYSNDRGTLMMDRGTYARLFKDESVNGAALYLKPGVSEEAATQDILKRLPADTQVFIRSTGQLRAEVLRIFDQTFAITYGMEAIALVVAVLGILATLTALILERRQEIVILRYVGAKRGQIWRIIFWEAGWIGLLGNLVGLGVGLVLALLLIQVINVQSFGWTIQWNVPWVFLGAALSLVFITTLAAGFYPARIASQLPAMKETASE